jgi:chorismate--pyruvate lyase
MAAVKVKRRSGMSKAHKLFPVNLSAQWQNAGSYLLKQGLRDWLLDADSLTARLKRHCQVFHVEVLGQHTEPCHALEANADIAANEAVLVREVLLYCDGIAQVFARSLLPLASLTGDQHQLAHIGNQPLGQVLFANKLLSRGNIEVACFDQQSSVAKLAKSLALPSPQKENEHLWGRRSLFQIQHKPIMVAEVFLPGSFAYQSELIHS